MYRELTSSDHFDKLCGWTQSTLKPPLLGVWRGVDTVTRSLRRGRWRHVACYADVTCHPIEYPLHVATLDYVESNLTTEDVRDALKWIRESYRSDLPLESPSDDTGQFRGLVVDSMKLRMADYAKELLNPDVPSKHRK